MYSLLLALSLSPAQDIQIAQGKKSEIGQGQHQNMLDKIQKPRVQLKPIVELSAQK